MKQPLRVLLHVDSLRNCGIAKLVTQLARGLDRARFRAIVSYSDDSGRCADPLRADGIEVESIVPGAGAEEAVRQIRNFRPDIFHSFSRRHDAYDVLAARAAGTPVVMTVREGTRWWSPSGTALNWEFDRNAATDIVTACVDAAAEEARAVEGIHPAKVAVVHPGVAIPEASDQSACPREELGVPAHAFTAGCAVGYSATHQELFQAWRRVVTVRPEAILICYGADPQHLCDSLRELACRLGLSRNIHLLEEREEMDSFYRALDLYIDVSRTGELPLSVLEAMSYGLPVIAGAGEVIEDGVSGMLTAPDRDALAETVLKLAGDASLGRALGEAAREHVRRHFSLARMIEEYESLYLRAAETRLPRELVPPAAPQFTGTPQSRPLDDTTVFVTTIGDATNFADCLAHLEMQTVRCRIELIDRVAPMSAAFAQMHQRCTTPYYVQVDEDMMLYPQALDRLRELIGETDASVPLVCAPLWDCDVERPIQGLKIYRHDIVRRFPYRDTLSCEVDQLALMAKAGHHALVISTSAPDAECLGEHGTHYTPQTIFARWQRLFHKHNELGHLGWMDPWPARLLERYVRTRDDLHLYAALGAIAGIASRADPGRECDWRDTNAAFQRLKHYFPAVREHEQTCAPEDGLRGRLV